MTMVVTAILLHVVATERWKWPTLAAGTMTTVFLIVDFAFLGANLIKIADGGWLPLLIGVSLLTLMTTWKTGRRIVADRLTARALPLKDFMAEITANPPVRVPGTAVFMTAQPTGTPPALAHNVHYNKVLHDHVVVLTARTEPTPFVSDDRASRSSRSVRASTTSRFSTASWKIQIFPRPWSLPPHRGCRSTPTMSPTFSAARH